MKTFRSIVAIFVFAAIFAVSAFAQTPTAATGKVGIVNTQAFDADKVGITKYVNAMNALEKELQPDITALQTMATKLQTLQTEITRIQEQARTNPNVPIKPETVNPKLEEYDKLGREFKFKQEEYKAKAERRQAAVMGPVRLDIGNALQEFAKKNGYMMILDASKLDGAGLLLAFDEKYDITKDFITFYNSRPAATAAK